MTVGQRITNDLSATNIESIVVRRQSTDVRSAAIGNAINLIGSTENLKNDLLLSKDELGQLGASISKTIGTKKQSEKSRQLKHLANDADSELFQIYEQMDPRLKHKVDQGSSGFFGQAASNGPRKGHSDPPDRQRQK